MNYIISGIIALLLLGSGYYMVAVRPDKMVEQKEDRVALTNVQENNPANSLTPPQTTAEQVSPPEQKPLTITKPKTTTVKGVQFTTNKGNITIELDGVNTPNTAMNFAKLVQAGFYDGIKFHRVIKGFMIQGGDPLTKDDAQMAAWGTGGPGYKFADEIKPTNHNLPGTISMANSGPNTNGSQFFINVQNNSFLDGKHTVFGKITSGMDVVTAIENVKTVLGDRPVDAVVIEKATLITE
jgi:peptidylprolyl isomerase